MEQLSALMDGELESHPAHIEVLRLKENPERQSVWGIYHIIGDALRGERLLSSRFSEQFARRLAQEPTVLAPRRASPKKLVTIALSVAASLSAVAMVAWVALSTGSVSPVLQPQVAQAPSASEARPTAPPMVSSPTDGRLTEYILAHQGFSPSTAIQGVTPYIRSVAAKRPTNTRQ